MRMLLALTLLLAPAFALADGHALPPGVSPPKPVGEPHVCMPQKWYPRIATMVMAEGYVGVAFRIGTDGTVKHPEIVHSSGYEPLNEATINCVSTFRYSPAMKDGRPVEVDWADFVSWRAHRTPPGTPDDTLWPPLPAAVNLCDAPPPGAPAKAVVAFVVGTDGTVRDIRLDTSSGDDTLDAYARSCVAAWRYQPAKQLGETRDFQWGAQVLRGE